MKMNLTDMIVQAGNEAVAAAKSLKKQGIIITRVDIKIPVINPALIQGRELNSAAEFVTDIEISFEPDNEA